MTIGEQAYNYAVKEAQFDHGLKRLYLLLASTATTALVVIAWKI